MNAKRIVWFLGFCIFAQAAWGHDVWLVDKVDRLELLYGHETPEVYNPVKVIEFKGYDKDGKPVALVQVPLPESFALRKDPQAAVISVVFDNGYWVEGSSTNWMNVSKETAESLGRYHHPIKLHKSIYAWSPGFAKPVGLKFEIVPQTDPFQATGTLPVQVVFDGKPLPGAKVEYGMHGDKAPSVQTDGEGRVSVPLTGWGEQFIAVDYAPDNPGPEQTSYATSLRYTLK